MSAEVLTSKDGYLAKFDNGKIIYIAKALKDGKVRSFPSRFPKLYDKMIKAGDTPKSFPNATEKNVNFIHKAMEENTGTEDTSDTSIPTPETDFNSSEDADSNTNENSTPKTTDNGRKEFVIDVKGLDIKNEIKYAVVEFVKLKCDADFDKHLSGIVNEAVKKLTPNYVKIGDRKQVKIEGRTHKAFEECLFLAQHHRQMFISGPAGSGKTTLGEQIAKAFGIQFAFINCSAGMSEAHLLGRMLFDGTYVPSDFIELYEKGGVFLMDEVDAADANTLLTINSALANGIVAVPNRKENAHAKRHKDFILIASGNTWGSGSFEYHGRNHLDAAFLDRFAMSRIFIDYDKKLEKEFCASCPELANVIWKIRSEVTKNKVRKIVSTRAFKEGAIAIAAGKTIPQVVNRFFTGWTTEEISKVYDASKLEQLQEEVIDNEEKVEEEV